MTHLRPSLAYPSLLLALCLAAACDQGETPIGGFEPEECTDPDDGDPPLDIVVDCTIAFADFTETRRFEPNVESVPWMVGGDLLANANLFDDATEGRSFNITFYDEAGTVGSTAIYQFASGTRPRNEFLGQHGFTGLNWVKDPASDESVQYACFARGPADPIQGWDE